MIAYNCPLNKLVCDGCYYLVTGGCSIANQSFAVSITREEMDEFCKSMYGTNLKE